MSLYRPDNRRAAELRREIEELRAELAKTEGTGERAAIKDGLHEAEHALFLTGSTQEELP